MYAGVMLKCAKVKVQFEITVQDPNKLFEKSVCIFKFVS